MTEEDLKISELGAYTNNSMNKEGLKKLCDKVNNASGGVEYTAGDNIQISAENVISATDTKYTAGSNIQISEQNVISATDTVYTAGTGISISEQNVISASGGSSGEWTLRTPNNDWSDLFDISNGDIISKKDIYFYIEDISSGRYIERYIPKGITASSITLNLMQPRVYNGKLIWERIVVNYTNIPSTNTYLSKDVWSADFTTDGTSITISLGSGSTPNFNKNYLTIYTKD